MRDKGFSCGTEFSVNFVMAYLSNKNKQTVYMNEIMWLSYII